MIFRECPDCKVGAFVRKDGVGKKCRPCHAKTNKGRKYIDIIGIRSGKIVVIERAHKINKQYHWKCICDCGKYLVTSGNRIRSGKTKSCGCITATQNGISASKMHTRWRTMISRCHNPKSISYKNYGARGIKVCNEWINSFDCFVNDMGKIPEGMTIDRIDGNGNYEPGNCRWVSMKEQSNNRRNNYLIKAFGQTLTLTQWANKIGMNWGVLRQRIERNHWSIEDALTIPVKKKSK